MKFETAMNKLEELSHKMESEDVSLDEALALYAEGAELIKTCNELLNEAENKLNEVNEL